MILFHTTPINPVPAGGGGLSEAEAEPPLSRCSGVDNRHRNPLQTSAALGGALSLQNQPLQRLDRSTCSPERTSTVNLDRIAGHGAVLSPLNTTKFDRRSARAARAAQRASAHAAAEPRAQGLRSRRQKRFGPIRALNCFIIPYLIGPKAQLVRGKPHPCPTPISCLQRLGLGASRFSTFIKLLLHAHSYVF